MLTISDLSLRIAGRLLIEDASIQIVPGARVGLVGRNGTGKSTLFRAIRGEQPIESGEILLPPRWRIGSLAQDIDQVSLLAVLQADLRQWTVVPVKPELRQQRQ